MSKKGKSIKDKENYEDKEAVDSYKGDEKAVDSYKGDEKSKSELFSLRNELFNLRNEVSRLRERGLRQTIEIDRLGELNKDCNDLNRDYKAEIKMLVKERDDKIKECNMLTDNFKKIMNDMDVLRHTLIDMGQMNEDFRKVLKHLL